MPGSFSTEFLGPDPDQPGHHLIRLYDPDCGWVIGSAPDHPPVSVEDWDTLFDDPVMTPDEEARSQRLLGG
jgi:hypothetical protein